MTTKRKRQHTTPCHDCPWRRKACPGWVGSKHQPEDWVAAAHGESRIDCHTTRGPHQCAGAAIYRSNVFKKPRDPKLLTLPPDPVTVFASPVEFIEHHRSRGHTSADAKEAR